MAINNRQTLRRTFVWLFRLLTLVLLAAGLGLIVWVWALPCDGPFSECAVKPGEETLIRILALFLFGIPTTIAALAFGFAASLLSRGISREEGPGAGPAQ